MVYKIIIPTLYSNSAGLIFTEDPQARSFSVGDAIDLRVNVSTDYYADSIRTLTWYHNGSAVESGDSRVTVNHTNLTIHSATPADAGTYLVKVTATDYGVQNVSCDSVWLPLMASLALYTPLTFTLTEECTGTNKFIHAKQLSISHIHRKGTSLQC